MESAVRGVQQLQLVREEEVGGGAPAPAHAHAVRGGTQVLQCRAVRVGEELWKNIKIF